ncbi:LysR family transcriptional regulator [Clostridium sp. B9]|uniref:LysR family transcriptional regulator n=1 Tax=Clostridium sp. B9 TaxID=3423224 RepID=UPI003D2EE2FE
MFHPQINTFLCVVECGSLNKASEKLYISATAVMKQMNLLEERLGIKLIIRNSKGIVITKAGKSLYDDLIRLKKEASKSIKKAQKIEQGEKNIIRVGTSILNPCNPFMDLWYSVSNKFPEFQVEIVPFDDNHENILGVIEELGNKFDFIIGVCDSKKWLNRCNFYQLGYYRKMVAVPIGHPLSNKKTLNLSDLYDEKLIMVKEGDSPLNDFLRHDLKQNHPRIIIEDTDYFYDMNVFNRCLKENCLLLNIECWSDVHPSLISIPVNWDYSIPYGILHSLNPSENVKRFLDMIKTI